MLNDTSITTAWFVGDDATTELPFTFKCLAQDQLLVKRENSDGTNTTLNYDSEYAVTLNVDQENSPGGTVTLVTALATGTRAVVSSNVPYTQPLDLQNAGKYHLQRIEDALDRATLQIRQIAEEAIRALHFPVGDTANGELPPVATRAGMLLQFDASGNVTVTDPGNVTLSSADFAVARAKRLVVGYDDDSDISNNTSTLGNNMLLIRYSTDYSVATTKNGIQIQKFIAADTGESINSGLKTQTILGAANGSDTPVRGDYRSHWDINVEQDNYSDYDDGTVSVGISSTIRRYGDQGLMAIHCNAMDMRVPETANETNFGGITGMEAHSDGVGPDRRAVPYGYRQTIRCVARTKAVAVEPTWDRRGSGAMTNSTVVLRDAICLPKNADMTGVPAGPYMGPYFVCVSNPSGTTGTSDTVLDSETTPGAQVVDGTVTWECRRGAEVGVGLKILNDAAADSFGYYRYGIIVDDANDHGNTNGIYAAIHVNNRGTINYSSTGSPFYHFYANDDTETCTVLLGSQEGVSGSVATSIVHKGDNASGASSTLSNWQVTLVDNTAGAEEGRLTFTVTTAGVGEQHIICEQKNTIIGEKQVLATTATQGFLHIGRCAGAPTGVPDLYTGKCPLVVDSTNGRLYIYHSGAWHYWNQTA